MINLSKKSFELLVKCLEAHNPSLIPTIKEKVEFSDALYNELRSAVGIELMAEGFDDKDEPTAYGLELEDLIDKIGRLFLNKNCS